MPKEYIKATPEMLLSDLNTLGFMIKTVMVIENSMKKMYDLPGYVGKMLNNLFYSAGAGIEIPVPAAHFRHPLL